MDCIHDEETRIEAKLMLGLRDESTNKSIKMEQQLRV